ncbi:MAG: M18 family aminopeptidase [Tissierellia bacterium]|nr:M18 family aminopeptidase [Tissierellia bacterium]
MRQKEFAKDLLNYIDNSPTAYQAVSEAIEILKTAGFNELKLEESWNILPNNSYYINIANSALFAFKSGSGDLKEHGFKIIGAHTDSPCFKLKPNHLMKSKNYVKLNTEKYGGMIMSTWFDRPLSIAGRCMLKGEDSFSPIEKNIMIEKDLVIIPNLAIHMNREINDGYKYNAQKDLLPIISLTDDDDEDLIKRICADELNVDKDEILSFDLYLYPREKGSLLGANEEFISAPRLDNLAMVHASIHALIESKPSKSTVCVSFADNEEIGSTTYQGAKSHVFNSIYERICDANNLKPEEKYIAYAKSFMLSADMAHGYHPNYPEKADPTNAPLLGKGPVIKVAASRSYSTDAFGAAVFSELAKNEAVNIQYYTNPSDIRGGSTIGSLSETALGIKNMDLGNAVFSMHSVRELGSVSDHYDIFKVFRAFFTEECL